MSIFDREFDIEPRTAEEITECASIEGMRRRIQRYQRSDAFTNAVLQASWSRGLSGEDTMTWLAFEALRRLEKLTDVQLEYLRLNPMPPIIFTSDSTRKRRSPYEPG